jgi:hypothetical protein
MKVVFTALLACSTAPLPAESMGADAAPGELRKQLLAFKPTNEQDAQKKAMELVPELGRAGSPENVLFAAKYRYAQIVLRLAKEAKEEKAPALRSLTASPPVRIIGDSRWPLYFAAVVLEQLEGGKLQRIQDGKETIEELVTFVAFMSREALEAVLGPPDMIQPENVWIYSKKAIDPTTQNHTVLHLHVVDRENVVFEYSVGGGKPQSCAPKLTLTTP